MAIEVDQFLAEKYSAKDPLFTEQLSTFEPTKAEPNVANINTIPGLDVSYFDCGVLPRYDLDDVVSDVRAVVQKHEKSSSADMTLELVQEEPAGPTAPQTSEIAVLLSKAVQVITGMKPRLVGIGSQTVANLFRRDGIPTAVWSTIADVPHEPNEYSIIKNLISDTITFAAIPLLV